MSEIMWCVSILLKNKFFMFGSKKWIKLCGVLVFYLKKRVFIKLFYGKSYFLYLGVTKWEKLCDAWVFYFKEIFYKVILLKKTCFLIFIFLKNMFLNMSFY